jgi:hypothetical protein
MKESDLRLYAEKLMIVRTDIRKKANQILLEEVDGPEEAKEEEKINNTSLSRKFEQKKIRKMRGK